MGKSRSCSLRREANAREIGPYDRITGVSAPLDRFAVIPFCQGAARNLKRTYTSRSDGREQMRKHEIFRTHPLRHCAEIGGTALAIKDWRRQSAVSIRSHD